MKILTEYNEWRRLAGLLKEEDAPQKTTQPITQPITQQNTSNKPWLYYVDDVNVNNRKWISSNVGSIIATNWFAFKEPTRGFLYAQIYKDRRNKLYTMDYNYKATPWNGQLYDEDTKELVVTAQQIKQQKQQILFQQEYQKQQQKLHPQQPVQDVEDTDTVEENVPMTPQQQQIKDLQQQASIIRSKVRQMRFSDDYDPDADTKALQDIEDQIQKLQTPSSPEIAPGGGTQHPK